MAKFAVLLLAVLALSEATPAGRPLDVTKIWPMRRTRPVLATAPKPRIIGGHNATPGLIPYQAMIVTDTDTLYGGTLISPFFVLTSGQAIYTHLRWTVTLGATTLSANSETWKVVQQSAQAIIHPSFSSGADIGLIQLPVYVTEHVYMSRATLPTLADVSNAFVGVIARASGFGLTTTGTVADTLQYLDAVVISNDDCLLVYGGINISPDDICAASLVGNTCAGDHGGPLVVDYGNRVFKVIGVSSFGDPLTCTSTIPGGYSRVTSYLGWILSITGLNDSVHNVQHFST